MGEEGGQGGQGGYHIMHKASWKSKDAVYLGHSLSRCQNIACMPDLHSSCSPTGEGKPPPMSPIPPDAAAAAEVVAAAAAAAAVVEAAAAAAAGSEADAGPGRVAVAPTISVFGK
jgi:hypothetical protein